MTALVRRLHVDPRYRQVAACAGLLLLSFALRLPFFLHPWDGSLSDTLDFLRAIHFLAGQATGPEAPFRLQYPVYPVLSLALSPVLASFIPAVIAPVIIFLAAWTIFRRMLPAILAGIVAAVSPPLLQYSGSRLYDSVFILATAVVALRLGQLVSKPTWSNAAFAGASCGIAWATRGQGVLYLAAIPYVLWKVAPSRFWRLTWIALVSFLAFGALPKLAMLLIVQHRGVQIENKACMKQLIEDGVLYSKGKEYRDLITYAPDYRNPCDDSWGDFIRKHKVSYPRSVVANASHMLYGTIASAMNPFIVIAFPLSIGIYLMASSSRVCLGALGLIAAGLIVAALLIQLQDRYLFPLVVPMSIITAAGLNFLFDRAKTIYWTLLSVILLAGLQTCYIAL